MGVQVKLVVYGSDEGPVRELSRQAFKEAKRLDDLLSDYKIESELSQLGDRAYPSAVEVSPDLFELLKLSKEIYEISEGYFDISSGELYKLWRNARIEGEPPTEDSINNARKRAGMDKVLLDPESSMVLLKAPFMKFDLGGIAKGYASERLLEIFRQNRMPVVLVDFGGSLAIGDSPPDGEWKVSIDGQSRSLSNIYLSSSGSDYQFLEIDGRTYSHIVNPNTGEGLGGSNTVIVMHSSGAWADAVSTTLFVLPKDKRGDFLSKINGVEVIDH